MKTTTLLLSAILPIFLFIGCLSDTEKDEAIEAFELIEQERPETVLTIDSVRTYMSLSMAVQPCLYDYNVDGTINTFDLLLFLDSNPPTIQLIEFLSVYGNEYVVDVIPAWNNFIQDFNCNLGWETYVRRQCDGIVTSFPAFDSLKWVADGVVISTNRNKLDFQNFDLDGNPLDECSGWLPPCNGINNVTMLVFNNGHTFERNADGWVYTNNFPDELPVCGTASQSPNLFGNDFLPYEFLQD